ncbi:MAG: ATP-binding protein [Eubacteriales bacterium]|nr:ATP-binding protein [Eubacteriales bacterium]
MKKKINQYLIGVSAFAIALTLIFTTCIFWRVELEQGMESLRETTRLLASLEGAGQPESLAAYVEAWEERGEGLRVTLIAQDGNVLYDSEADAAGMDNHADRPEVEEAIRSGTGEGMRYSSTIGASTIYCAMRMDSGSVLRTSMTTDGVLHAFLQLIPLAIVMIAVLVALASVLSMVLTRRFIAPIREMALDPLRKETPETYRELKPLMEMISSQQKEVLAAAGMRQEFTANVSHELKTPLTAISGYAELIETGIAPEKDVMRFAQEIHQNADRLLKLINDIIRLSELDMGAAEQDREERVDLHAIAKGCVESLQVNARNYDVTISENGECAQLTAYRQQMEELVYNLCDNAIRYNVKGGSVSVSVEPIHQGEAACVCLTVRDTGIGIPNEHLGRIFERFYRVDKSRSKQTGGTGLGLAIVKHIVAQAGGTIRIRSTVGKGTTITVLLPEERGSRLENGNGA